MLSEQREALDEIIIKSRAGRISRRTFLERVLSLGLTSSIASSLLAACEGTSPNPNGTRSTPIITWISEHDSAGLYNQLVDAFNATNKDGIHVVYINGAIDSGQLHTMLAKDLQARNGSIDVLSLDVIWPAEFASKRWVLPLDDRWPQSARAQYLPGTIEACMFNNRLWAAPYRVGVGLIYYRTDLVSVPPETWNELKGIASQSLKAKKGRYGYIWQGAQYEGLVCNFVEVLYGYGGAVLDPNDSQKVVVNSPEAVQALTEMVSWVGTISPRDITSYKEEDARISWENGYATFMRNWPRVYSLANDPKTSQVAGKFDVHTMLYGGNNPLGHSCVGGELLSINAYSKEPDAAWRFIQYMIEPATQKNIALHSSLSTALAGTYSDPDVLAKNPYVEKFRSAFQNAKPRPVSSRYPDISKAIQQRVFEALNKKYLPTDALAALETDLQAIIKG